MGSWVRLREASLGAKLILFSTLLTVAAVAITFGALSVEIRRQTRRVLADTLDQHQRTILEVQRRERDEMLWISRLMTESPTLRAAMETYQAERGASTRTRPDLLATIQAEAERISGGLDRDLLIVTDQDGTVLAVKDRLGAGPLVGADLSRAPVVRQALEEEEPSSGGAFAVLEIGGRPYQAGCVPIVLQGFTIGALALGEALDADFARHLGATFDSDVLVALGDKIVGATLPQAGSEAGLLQRLNSVQKPSSGAALIDWGREEFVAAALPLGVDGSGRRATVYLLQSLTRAMGPSNRTMVVTLLIYGTCAVVLAGLSAWWVSRALLLPLESFVGFLKGVTASGDHSRRFERMAAEPEVRTLSQTYNQLMDSLQQHEQRLLARAREDLDRMDRLKESEKLAALGRMLSGAAHEINNPLTGVLGNLDILLGDQHLDGGVRGRLEKVRKEGQRIVGLVRNLLKTAHRDSGERAIVDLNQLVRETAALRQHDFANAGVGLKLDLANAKCRIFGSELELQQIAINIINNAFDALRDAGTKSPQVIVRTSATEESVGLEFLDNGPGMKEPQRVFEHFYTTKEIGKGTGLGLSITHAIVQNHGGRIVAENRPEGGARFAITLPALANENALTEAAKAAAPRPAATPGMSEPLRASVLVVDDEPSVLELELAILEAAGATAVGARSGAAAIEEMQRREFDLIVTDLKMPGQVSGQDLYHWAETNRPEAAKRFIFVTGDTVAEGTVAFLEKTSRRCVQKPFAIEDYMATLRETLDEHKAA